MAALWIAAVGLITLTPAPELRPDAERLILCLTCGSRGTADALLNVVLFLPLGFLVGLRHGIVTAWVVGLLLSAGVEVSQFFIPGRFSNVGDVFWNAGGAALGAVTIVLLRRWLHTGQPDPTSTLPGDSPTSKFRAAEGRAAPGSKEAPLPAAVAALALPALYLFLAGALLVPRGTDARYYGQWTARLAHLEPYQGTLVDARLNGQPFPDGEFPAGLESRSWLEGPVRLTGTVRKGPPPAAVSPIMSVFDGAKQEIILLGAHREDLVFRQRTLGVALGLDYAELRLRGALSRVPVGEEMTISTNRTGSRVCLGVDWNGETQRGCPALTPGQTWRLLMNLEGASAGFIRWLSAAWMATLFLLAGLISLGRGRRRETLGVVAVAVLVTASSSWVTPLTAPTLLEWCGVFSGLLAGWSVRPLVRAFVAPGAKVGG
jgi:hypothetical protein